MTHLPRPVTVVRIDGGHIPAVTDLAAFAQHLALAAG
jgi:hypothetical protein